MTRFVLLSLAIPALLFAGCSDGRPTIVKTSGQVLINGKPLQFKGDGFIQVIPEKSRAATGKINPDDGSFTLTSFEEGDGVALGTHKVTVMVNVLGAGGNAINLLPDKYADVETTDLQVTIEQPTDSLKIELEGDLRQVSSSDNAAKGDYDGL